MEDLLDDDGDETKKRTKTGRKSFLKRRGRRKEGEEETSSSSDFEPFGAEVPMEHRMPTMSQRPTPPRRRRAEEATRMTGRWRDRRHGGDIRF